MKIHAPLTALLAVTLCGGPAPAADDVPLIPRRMLFCNPSHAGPRISPKGTRLSFLAPVDGVLNVWVGPAGDADKAEPVTRDEGRGIRAYRWAHTDKHILYLKDDGQNAPRLHRVHVLTGETKALTPETDDSGRPLTARLERVSPLFPRDVVVALNERDPDHPDLFVVNIDTGERVELARNDQQFTAFHVDDEYNVMFGEKPGPDGGMDLLKQNDEGAWETFTQIPREDLFTTGVVGFDASGEHVYMVDSRGRDTAALKSVNLETGASRTLAKDRDADISGGVLIHPTERTVQAASSTYSRREWHVVDEALREDFDYLGTVAEGELSVLSRTTDDQQWIVAFEMDAGPARYYRYDREGRSAHYLFTDRPALEGLPLAAMHDHVIKSRDRQNLVSYYTLPPGTDRRGRGRPARPLPMVLWVHGGPWARDTWGYEPVHQWLANRGYAVLSVNYRGSVGFGKKFIKAGNWEWGNRMQHDLVDAVEWAVERRIADPQRIAVMGASYGGYAALGGLIATPDTFACGIDVMGPPNLVSFLETVPADRLDVWATRVGDPRTEDGRNLLMDRSPITHVDRIDDPLLVVQGAADPRVHRSEADQLVETLRGNGVDVTYVVFPDEGHGIRSHANRLAFYTVAEAFLAEHLGGRFEPAGGEFQDSTITIPVGGDRIAGATAGASP